MFNASVSFKACVSPASERLWFSSMQEKPWVWFLILFSYSKMIMDKMRLSSGNSFLLEDFGKSHHEEVPCTINGMVECINWFIELLSVLINSPCVVSEFFLDVSASCSDQDFIWLHCSDSKHDRVSTFHNWFDVPSFPVDFINWFWFWGIRKDFFCLADSIFFKQTNNGFQAVFFPQIHIHETCSVYHLIKNDFSIPFIDCCQSGWIIGISKIHSISEKICFCWYFLNVTKLEDDSLKTSSPQSLCIDVVHVWICDLESFHHLQILSTNPLVVQKGWMAQLNMLCVSKRPEISVQPVQFINWIECACDLHFWLSSQAEVKLLKVYLVKLCCFFKPHSWNSSDWFDLLWIIHSPEDNITSSEIVFDIHWWLGDLKVCWESPESNHSDKFCKDRFFDCVFDLSHGKQPVSWCICLDDFLFSFKCTLSASRTSHHKNIPLFVFQKRNIFFIVKFTRWEVNWFKCRHYSGNFTVKFTGCQPVVWSVSVLSFQSKFFSANIAQVAFCPCNLSS